MGEDGARRLRREIRLPEDRLIQRLGTLDGLQPGVTAIKTIELPAMAQLAAAIPPEAEAAVSGAKQSLSISGVLLHEQDDLYQMGYAVRAVEGTGQGESPRFRSRNGHWQQRQS